MAGTKLCVIYNPMAGRRRAGLRLERLRHHWGTHAAFWPTQGPGHAEELSRRAVDMGFDIVAAAGGDGTAHEVANGLLAANRPGVEFALLPIGSANDYAFSLGLEDGKPRPTGVHTVDAGLVRAPGGRERYFVCCLGLGLNGAVTLESRRIRRLQGLALYGLATLRALWYHYDLPQMTFTLDDGQSWSSPTLLFSALIGRREGNFVMAPDAKLDDGLFDYVHAGAVSRWEALRLLPRVAFGGPPRDHPKVRLGRCRTVRLASERPLIVHIDGEFFCTPEDGVRELDIQVLPQALRVQMSLTPDVAR